MTKKPISSRKLSLFSIAIYLRNLMDAITCTLPFVSIALK